MFTEVPSLKTILLSIFTDHLNVVADFIDAFFIYLRKEVNAINGWDKGSAES
jgi:hypothetical protein